MVPVGSICRQIPANEHAFVVEATAHICKHSGWNQSIASLHDFRLSNTGLPRMLHFISASSPGCPICAQWVAALLLGTFQLPV